MAIVRSMVEETLDQAEACLRSMKVEAGMSLLLENLQSAKRLASPDLWKTICDRCLTHPIRELVHQDPLTLRAFKKNKIHSYACDPVLLDFLYAHPSIEGELAAATPLGREINQFLCRSPTAESLRWRQRFLAQQIDLTARLFDKAQILAVASGRLREGLLSESLQNGELGRFVAFDQDPESSSCIARERDFEPLELRTGRIRDLLREPLGGQFDLIYSAGLYDYLPDAIAVSLTSRLIQQLSPAGRLLIAVFVPDNYEGGYMEGFMKWSLIYREINRFKKLMEQANPGARLTVFRDESNHAAWFEIQRSHTENARDWISAKESPRLLQALL